MHQYLFFIGSFPIRAYGLLFLSGIVAAGMTAYYIMKRDGRGWHVHIFDFTMYCGLSGIVGGRLWDVFFFDWPYYHNHLSEIPFVWQGGMAIQGGLIFGAVAGILYTRFHQIDTWAFGDLLAPAIILGQSIGRMANLMNGDAFGHPTGSGFGIIYPDTTLAYRTYGNQPLWPAEVWEGQIDILIFVILLFFSSFRHKKGQVFSLYVMLYAVERFFLEYLRGDYNALLWGFKSAQWTSIVAFAAAAAVFTALQFFGTYDTNDLVNNDKHCK
ncbi:MULTISPECIES: prolipoprotein diacylglyceryl transferase [Megasphaera]|uniref:Phosphatidylglycerol--prolipoprotein diacylglyceryl transferase n=1 Tax=Megasphaera vaginalis (ex Srinivasan et al. 2021) TaxID=1111454 RepID=U7UND2_9FIRM|nr:MULTISPECIES: prolipoprotein diacylglyceryl transferase [Megasphaera]ERT60414.1 prolipoprotein diacylglyceryl transferase [Megasphaera vaginalis (ex Srinivasan et al. 2021)]